MRVWSQTLVSQKDQHLREAVEPGYASSTKHQKIRCKHLQNKISRNLCASKSNNVLHRTLFPLLLWISVYFLHLSKTMLQSSYSHPHIFKQDNIQTKLKAYLAQCSDWQQGNTNVLRSATKQGKHVGIFLKYLLSFQKFGTQTSWARGGFLYLVTLRDLTSTHLSRLIFEPSKLLATVTSNNKELCSAIPPSSCLFWTCHLLPLMPYNPSVVRKLKDQSLFILSLCKSLFILSLACASFLPSPKNALGLRGLTSLCQWKRWHGYCSYLSYTSE